MSRSSPRRVTGLVILLLLAAQYGLWGQLRLDRANTTALDPAPTATFARATFLGDREAAYRYYGLVLQTAGNSGGQVVAISAYDTSRLGEWLKLLDALDPKGETGPFLAAYYFSRTSNDKLRPIVEYLHAHGAADPLHNWVWLAHAVYLAENKLKDHQLAISIARDLYNVNDPSLPVWTRQLLPLLLAREGDQDLARDLMLAILGSTPASSRNESRFMQDFINGAIKPQKDNGS